MKLIAAVLSCLLLSSHLSAAQTKTRIQEKQDAPQAPASTSAPVPNQANGPSAPNTLLDGTAVKLRLSENLTSATAKTGQQVSFEVLEEVDVEGMPVIAKGAQALATITMAEPKRTMGGRESWM